MALDAIAAKVITSTGVAVGGVLPGASVGRPGEPALPIGNGEGFGASLERLIGTVQQSHASANTAIAGMLDGQTDVHDAMIAMQRADLTLQFAVQVRNKVVQAYQDIMRMPV